MKDKEYWMLVAQHYRKQGFKQHQIAEMLGVTTRTVRNYLTVPPKPRKRTQRSSKLDRHKPFINSIIKDDPYYNCMILYDRIVKQGYHGRISILRDYVARIRKQVITEAVIRFETEPGQQAQVDWKEYRRVRPDGRREKVYAFVMLLGYSRKPFIVFTRSMNQSVLLACHILAFIYFGGIPHEILYDNMKTAFCCDTEGRWKPTKRLLAFANHYGFIPRRCRVRRPQTKGKVERAIGYMNINFWPRVKNHVWGLSELCEAVGKWCTRICRNKLRDFGETRAQRFEYEKSFLLPLPVDDFDVRDYYYPIVSRESLITHKTNRYSVPPEYIGRKLTLKVHPFSGIAELSSDTRMIREMILEKAGSRKKIMTVEDKRAIKNLWARQQRKRTNRTGIKDATDEPAVEIRSPVVYDKLLPDGR
jgi:transposase